MSVGSSVVLYSIDKNSFSAEVIQVWTWGWVNDDSMRFFRWTLPLTSAIFKGKMLSGMKLLKLRCICCMRRRVARSLTSFSIFSWISCWSPHILPSSGSPLLQAGSLFVFCFFSLSHILFPPLLFYSSPLSFLSLILTSLLSFTLSCMLQQPLSLSLSLSLALPLLAHNLCWLDQLFHLKLPWQPQPVT